MRVLSIIMLRKALRDVDLFWLHVPAPSSFNFPRKLWNDQENQSTSPEIVNEQKANACAIAISNQQFSWCIHFHSLSSTKQWRLSRSSSFSVINATLSGVKLLPTPEQSEIVHREEMKTQKKLYCRRLFCFSVNFNLLYVSCSRQKSIFFVR